MPSLRKIEANRRNAQASTGPRSPEGKAAVAGNAITHGLRAKKHLLYFERYADFDRICADLTAEWAIILKDRLAMYRRLREETERAGTPSGHDAFYRSYVRFVDLVQQLVLGGVRIFAER